MTTVEKIKAKILDLAIRGKLVPQDPNDEPASVLLERIKAEKAELVKAKKIKKDKNPSEIIIGSDGVPYEKFEGEDNLNAETQRRRVEVPFDLPVGWAWCKWRDISISVQYGYNAPAIESGRIRMVRITDIQDNSIMWNDVPYCQIDDTKIPQYMLHKGDILFARTGSTVGKSILIKDAPFDAVFAGYLVRTQCVSNILPQFAKCFLESSVYWNQLKNGMTATAQPNFNGEKLSSMIFPLPPLAEQKRIVAKVEELFAYADQIGSASEEITKTAQRLDKKILDLAIRGKLVPQDSNDEPASQLVKRIEKQRQAKTDGKKSRTAASHKPTYEIEPPFDIPESWQWVRLGSLIQIIAGVSYQKDEVTTSGVRILRGGNIKEDARIYLHNDDVFLPATYTDEDTSIKTGDIVIVASTGSSTVIGRPAVATETMHNVQIGAFLRIVRSVDDSITSWLPVVFLGNYYRSHIRSKSKGTNIKNLKAEYLTELSVPLPPLAEQKRIVAKIEELRAMTRALTT